jgi:hypothetical protein
MDAIGVAVAARMPVIQGHCTPTNTQPDSEPAAAAGERIAASCALAVACAYTFAVIER